ncbi:hypothetical protein C8039_05165 [Halogeometricum sp. wsp3]|nr:hypothetical protein C8039_05165 [Halogeometricum sp. wsp3]
MEVRFRFGLYSTVAGERGAVAGGFAETQSGRRALRHVGASGLVSSAGATTSACCCTAAALSTGRRRWSPFDRTAALQPQNCCTASGPNRAFARVSRSGLPGRLARATPGLTI